MKPPPQHVAEVIGTITASARYRACLCLLFPVHSPNHTRLRSERVSYTYTQQVVDYALTLEKLEADFLSPCSCTTNNGGLNAPQVAKRRDHFYGEDEAQRG